MPTILLQEIRDLLAGFIGFLQSIVESIDANVASIKDNTDELVTDAGNIDGNVSDIKTINTAINGDTTSISTAVTTNIVPKINSIDGNVSGIASNVSSIDSKTTTVINTLNTGNNSLTDIKNNTGSLVTPVARINENVSSININVNAMKTDLHDVAGYTDSIADSSGQTATYAEDIATNTLNAYNKLYTISEDTTQIRADLSNIYSVITQTDYTQLLTDILAELRGTQNNV